MAPPLIHQAFLLLTLLSPLTTANPLQDARVRDNQAPSRPNIRQIAPSPRALLPRQNAASTSSTRTTSTRSTSTSLVPERVTVADYSYLGCFQDGSNHILTVTSEFDTGMTPELCRNFCLVAECGIFGLKDQYSCLCGRQVEPFAATAPEAECSEGCRGAKGALCGASARMNVYSATVALAEVDRGAVPTSGGDAGDGSGDNSNGQNDGDNDNNSNSNSNGGGGGGGGVNLSGGAIAGIVIGTAAFVALVAGLVAYLFFRRLINRLKPEPQLGASDPSSPSPATGAAALAGTKEQTPEQAPEQAAAMKSEFEQQQQGGHLAYIPPAAAQEPGSLYAGSAAYDPSSAFMSPVAQTGSPAGGVAIGQVPEAHGQPVHEAPGIIAYEMPGDGFVRQDGLAEQPHLQQQHQQTWSPPPQPS
ncbi:hypothetical protein SAPIO_CDS9730 [Scedosporium apiospermum]|uniref:WSC domain-containing protein n=1 Tax=Pseudallescheria apiosperma TaxID=563466 RepID=A0A084FXF6_PSEDA|nr:uncharacterized protein SAPIO_CDS9730 [Scedosporium apiospermum]KEZ39768.1 hypothetical protein SAPIO_CDS9730 [Scedosporium apiospermum]